MQPRSHDFSQREGRLENKTNHKFSLKNHQYEKQKIKYLNRVVIIMLLYEVIKDNNINSICNTFYNLIFQTTSMFEHAAIALLFVELGWF